MRKIVSRCMGALLPNARFPITSACAAPADQHHEAAHTATRHMGRGSTRSSGALPLSAASIGYFLRR
jgi:hypothetical protein